MDPNSTKEWSSGLCSCCDDCGICVLSFCCPCIQYGMSTEMFGEGVLFREPSCAVHAIIYIAFDIFGLGCIVLGLQRQLVREKYGIKGTSFNDFCCSCCCQPCTLAQVSREIKANGGVTKPLITETAIPGNASFQQAPLPPGQPSYSYQQPSLPTDPVQTGYQAPQVPEPQQQLQQLQPPAGYPAYPAPSDIAANQP